NCQRHLAALTHEQSQRAKTSWGEDRAGEAEAIAVDLAKAPGDVGFRLRSFKQGAQWLRRRWEGLVNLARATGQVSHPQPSTALALLAVPHDVRVAGTPLDIDGKSPVEALIEVTAAEIAALQARIDEVLEHQDDVARTQVEMGYGPPTHEMKLIQRYLTAAI